MQARTAGGAPASILVTVVLIAGLAACGGNSGAGGLFPGADTSAPTTETVTLTDPVDNSFTVEVPKGWDSVAYSSGGFDVHRNVVSSVSPDGKTVLFYGDPKEPTHWVPHGLGEFVAQYMNYLDIYDIREHQPAQSYFPEYVTRKFGELPGFKILEVGPSPELNDPMQRMLDTNGAAAMGFSVTAAEVRFSYRASGEMIEALVAGTVLFGGDSWVIDVMGVATNRKVEDYRPMLTALHESVQFTPEYVARDKTNHEQTMAQIQAFSDEMTRRHNANMAWIQNSAAAHQSRMEAIWAQGDASMESYYSRMDSMDHTQRDFLNYINEEETVSGGETGTRQVASGATNYWVNKNDGTYVGGDINFDEAQLRELGLNPNDYEQVTVVK